MCKHASDCKFAHSEDELCTTINNRSVSSHDDHSIRMTPTLYSKTKPCVFFTKGECKYGNTYHFSHEHIEQPKKSDISNTQNIYVLLNQYDSDSDSDNDDTVCVSDNTMIFPTLSDAVSVKNTRDTKKWIDVIKAYKKPLSLDDMEYPMTMDSGYYWADEVEEV